jgi:hypothetical protein
MIEPLCNYRQGSDLERRLESIALVGVKQRAFGETPDMSFPDAARNLGLNDLEGIARIRRRATGRWNVIRRLASPCIFEEADRKARLSI